MIYYNFLEKHSIKNKLKIRNWINKSVEKENKKLNTINIIICSDSYLLKMNKDFLNHNYYTDIITFDYSENNNISGDLFISIDRIKENAVINNTTTENELLRVFIHGILHLCGYLDKTKNQQKIMRNKENEYLNNIDF